MTTTLKKKINFIKIVSNIYFIIVTSISFSAFSAEYNTMVIMSEHENVRQNSGSNGIIALLVYQRLESLNFMKFKYCTSLPNNLTPDNYSNCKDLFNGNYVHKNSFQRLKKDLNWENFAIETALTSPLLWVKGVSLTWKVINLLIDVKSMSTAAKVTAWSAGFLLENIAIQEFLYASELTVDKRDLRVVAKATTQKDSPFKVILKKDDSVSELIDLYDERIMDYVLTTKKGPQHVPDCETCYYLMPEINTGPQYAPYIKLKMGGL